MTLGHDELIRLWFTGETIAEISARLDIKSSDILAAWRKMKMLGQLPNGNRPRNRSSGFDALINNGDGRPSIDQNYDPLLERLWKHHRDKMEKLDE